MSKSWRNEITPPTYCDPRYAAYLRKKGLRIVHGREVPIKAPPAQAEELWIEPSPAKQPDPVAE